MGADRTCVDPEGQFLEHGDVAAHSVSKGAWVRGSDVYETPNADRALPLCGDWAYTPQCVDR